MDNEKSTPNMDEASETDGTWESDLKLVRTLSRQPTLSNARPNAVRVRQSFEEAICQTYRRRLQGDLERGETTDESTQVIDGDEEKDANIVVWDGEDDPDNPRNWPTWRKVSTTAVASLAVFAVSFASSIFGTTVHVTSEIYGMSVEAMNLGVALFILGFAGGPLFFGPLSEIYGHVVPYTIAFIGLTIFQIPVALAENVRTILVCRFFGGVFGSGIFAIVSGIFVELWEPITRGVALGLSSICINLGSTVAPVVGAYATDTIGWRWTAWITLILCLVLGIASLFCIRETSTRVILVRKARHLRLTTGNWALHSASEELSIDFRLLLQKYITKPVRMFIREPILVILTLYLTLVYGTLYLAYQAFPIAFQSRGWSAPTASLPFIAVDLGILSAWAIFSIFTTTWYKRRWLARRSSLPEDRLPPMLVGALLLPPSLLWFGWSTTTHWISQVLASYFIGVSLLLVFIAGIVYIVDVYNVHANSAMSIHVVVRSIVASSFPLFATPLYDGLGIEWATTLLAGLCVLMIPAPFVFLKFGKRIRGWSHFSFNAY
ncbi:putative mfs multidrug [Phaeomoniella chlamydospora]|uniref:Putative mfs multidrug n=1 Tax=Phaeomoniella chlamydospora TaxID=158046 RepID=A0A0G2EVP5_PHACM|nr:putative mfs multidrug [Phaeomoniella chlamydospora]